MSESGVTTGNESTIPVAPEFFVRDLSASLGFYIQALGFRAVRTEASFAVVALGDAYVLLAVADKTTPSTREWPAIAARRIGCNIRIMVDDIEAIHRRVSKHGVAVVHEIGDREFGLRDFIVADPDGFLLRFAAPIAR